MPPTKQTTNSVSDMMPLLHCAHFLALTNVMCVSVYVTTLHMRYLVTDPLHLVMSDHNKV